MLDFIASYQTRYMDQINCLLQQGFGKYVCWCDWMLLSLVLSKSNDLWLEKSKIDLFCTNLNRKPSVFSIGRKFVTKRPFKVLLWKWFSSVHSFYYAKDKVKPRTEIKIIGLFLCPASIKIQAKITMAIPVIHSFSLEKNHVKHILAYSLQTNRVMQSEWQSIIVF